MAHRASRCRRGRRTELMHGSATALTAARPVAGAAALEARAVRAGAPWARVAGRRDGAAPRGPRGARCGRGRQRGADRGLLRRARPRARAGRRRARQRAARPDGHDRRAPTRRSSPACCAAAGCASTSGRSPRASGSSSASGAARLRAAGALAVDMESAWLAPAAAGSRWSRCASCSTPPAASCTARCGR